MIGETVSHYRILGKLGGGGMGVIYEAEDTRLGRRVALKFIPDNLAGDKNALERFEREARAASQLAHPNICTIHDIEDNGGHPFLVMEKLDGESLKQRIHRGPMAEKELLDIAVQTASALEASHAKGIIHRDIKPGNIFLAATGPVKVLDFGLAKLTQDHPLSAETEDLTAADVVPGTAIYMSPEQARSETLDPRTDLFSFGVMLYEMATGTKPFHGKNTVTTLSAVLRDKPKSPAELNPKISPELVGIIGKAMQKNRRYRYQNAAAIKSDLQHLQKKLEGGTVSNIRLNISTDTFQGSHRRLAIVLGSVVALLLTVLVTAGVWWIRHRSQTPIPPNSVAVLPLSNVNHDARLDNLRFSLADAMSRALTNDPTLAVRPSSEIQKYAGDPRKAGRELRAAVVISGHFLAQGERLTITLEAVDVGTNTLLWQTTVPSITDNAAFTQAQVVAQMRQGLLPVLRREASKKR
jgi:eukaryotic-like serine/threonine-protein kinase